MRFAVNVGSNISKHNHSDGNRFATECIRWCWQGGSDGAALADASDVGVAFDFACAVAAGCTAGIKRKASEEVMEEVEEDNDSDFNPDDKALAAALAACFADA